MALLADTAATPFSSFAEAPTSGLGIRAHAVPFQCRVRVWSAAPLMTKPTAQALLADVASAAARPLAVPGAGLACRFQAVPFQCRIMFWTEPPAEVKSPAAQALLADVAVTPVRPPPPAGVGLAACFHLLPFQCRTRV